MHEKRAERAFAALSGQIPVCACSKGAVSAPLLHFAVESHVSPALVVHPARPQCCATASVRAVNARTAFTAHKKEASSRSLNQELASLIPKPGCPSSSEPGKVGGR